MTEIKNIAVIGAGAMGSQIGMVCALAGFAVAITDLQADALHRAAKELRQRMARDVAKGRRTQDEVDTAFGQLTFSTDLSTAAATADYVIEAAVEKLDVKRRLFADLDRITPPHAILATNSSTIVSSRIADATRRPDRVCNLHFFNPALVMKCVEVVRGPDTSDQTVHTSIELARRLGKTPVLLDREIPGFIANRILGAVRDEAIYLLENGIASVEDIDTACRTALGYPMGPFELMDLTGIDIGYLTKKDRFATSGDPKDQPSKSVSALVERGELGRKTGRGWYDYDQAGTKTARPSAELTSS
ncbi:MAG: 3-hydroxyacyl-CoA dehydrogenase family protein [Nakamurella sp.]